MFGPGGKINVPSSEMCFSEAEHSANPLCVNGLASQSLNERAVLCPASPPLDVEIGHEGCILLDEVEARLWLGAHQPVDADTRGVEIVADLDLQ